MSLEAKERRRYLDRIEQLEEENRQLREAKNILPVLEVADLCDQLGLTPTEAKIFALLRDNEIVTREQFEALIDPSLERQDAFQLARVYLSKLRKKLDGRGYVITNRRGLGHSMTGPTNE